MRSRRTTTILIGIIIMVTVFFAGCNQRSELEKLKGESDQGATDTTAPIGLSEETTTTEGASAEDSKTASPDATSNSSQIAVIQTNKGVIKFELYPDVAPKTVENFVKLAKEGFYDGTKWHRVVADFVIQGGDPNSKDSDPSDDGTGGPGYNIPAEFNSKKHLEGTVAMARSQDPNSAGSQFYICLSPQPSLDNNYTIFGQVIEGIEVVHQIRGYDEKDGQIVTFDSIEKVTIEDK